MSIAYIESKKVNIFISSRNVQTQSTFYVIQRYVSSCFLILQFLILNYLTQCARIRVPVVSMKIEKFKDLFRAALDRWVESHDTKNFGFGRTRRPIRPIFSAILPILGKI